MNFFNLISLRNIVTVLGIISVYSLVLSSCSPQKMERKLVAYDGEAIKTNGYYYSKDCKIYFFFKNGVFRTADLNGDSISSLDDTIPKYNWTYFNDIDIYYGGFWQEDSSTFEFQGWTPTEVVHDLLSYNVKVLSDSTFLMIDSQRVYGEDRSTFFYGDTFYFKKSSFKPDSLYFERNKNRLL